MGAMVIVSLLGGILTVVVGGYLLSSLVFAEAQRRVDVALKTARAGLDGQGERARLAAAVAAEASRDSTARSSDEAISRLLEMLRAKGNFDYIHLIDKSGTVRATARGEAVGIGASESRMVRDALSDGVARTSLRLVPMLNLSVESPDLAERALVRVSDTAMSRRGGPTELREGMVLEAVSPIVESGGQIGARCGLGSSCSGTGRDALRSSIFWTHTAAITPGTSPYSRTMCGLLPTFWTLRTSERWEPGSQESTTTSWEGRNMGCGVRRWHRTVGAYTHGGRERRPHRHALCRCPEDSV